MSDSHPVLHFNKGAIPHKKYGHIEDFDCHIICVSPKGEYKAPTQEDTDEQVQYLIDWESKIGIPTTKHGVKYEKLAKSAGGVSLCFAPNLPSKSDKIRALGSYIYWTFIMDDVIDETKGKEPLTTTYEAISADFNVLTSILDGEINGKTNPPEPTSTMAHFKVMCAIMQDIYETLSRATPAFEKKENRKYFVKTVNDFLHSMLWNFERPNADHCSEFVYLNNRNGFTAFYSILELLALLNEFDWAASGIDREDLEFRLWKTSCVTAVSMTNDVMSLRKEIGEGERENLVIHRHLNSGLSINQALKKTVHDLNTELHDVQIYGARLLKHNPVSLDLKKLIQLVFWSLDGHLWWYKSARRHGKIEIREYQMTGEECHEHIHGHKKKHNYNRSE